MFARMQKSKYLSKKCTTHEIKASSSAAERRKISKAKNPRRKVRSLHQRTASPEYFDLNKAFGAAGLESHFISEFSIKETPSSRPLQGLSVVRMIAATVPVLGVRNLHVVNRLSVLWRVQSVTLSFPRSFTGFRVVAGSHRAKTLGLMTRELVITFNPTVFRLMTPQSLLNRGAIERANLRFPSLVCKIQDYCLLSPFFDHITTA